MLLPITPSLSPSPSPSSTLSSLPSSAIVVIARRVITIIVDLSPVATCLSSSSVAVAYVISNKLMPSDVNFICLIRHLTQLIVK
jgi:hypothetical protein